MRLSMHILADWLEKYNPKASIQNGKRQIRNVRPFSDKHAPVSSNVYVSQLSNEAGGGVMCINDNDIIFIPSGDADEIINDIMDAFDYYNNWQNSIDVSKMSIQEILDKSYDVLPDVLMVADSAYYVLAHSGLKNTNKNDSILFEVEKNSIMDMETIKKIEKNPMIRSKTKKAYVQEDDFFPSAPVTRNLFSGDNHVGWLLYVSEKCTLGKCDIVDELGDTLEAWFDVNTEQNAFLDISGVFIEILQDNPDKNRLLNKLHLAGLDASSDKYVYVTNFGENVSGYAGMHHIRDISSGTASFIFEDLLVTVFYGSNEDRLKFEKKINSFTSKSFGKCGVSPSFQDFFDLKKNYILAKSACDLSDKFGITNFSDIILKYAESLISSNTATTIVHPALTLLKEYDLANHTDLCNTLKVYLKNERNLADAARELYIHRNSLIYRIGRISELTTVNLDDPETRFHLLLSFDLDTSQ